MNTPYASSVYEEAAAFVRGRIRHQPQVGLILGSGLSELADQIADANIIPYAKIPHFPVSTVAGHVGQLVVGQLAGVAVCVMQGRFHYYEGYPMQQVTLPVRVMQRLGANLLIVTNAAGGLNPAFATGDIMLIEDHINLAGMAGANPLRGPNLEDFGPRFPAANHIYTPRLRALTNEVAAHTATPLRRGVYLQLSGPNFESPAEVRMLRGLGADAVGMSTAAEAMVAHHAGMEVLGLSTITNVAIDHLEATGQPSHQEVVEAGAVIVPRLSALLLGVLTRLASLL
ncbi:MAG: purine-nucleoside phosphorylase [Caldilinea sp.]|uniref:purine-nucleoside phosphorylase n=1 Tax=Caldilinea sp. TaxID=2293560 RepID=UPI002BD5C95A|nr:purine-nucleoside phosphorylase [Anaerolineales bacterium]HQY91374.1 purine-nucleoside phosphorylase [Caldilinea sp.]